MEILYTGTGWLQIIPLLTARLNGHRVRRADPTRSVAEQVADVEVLLPSNRAADRAVIDAAPRLVLIQQPAVGFEGIDLEAAKERQLPVCNAPGTNADSVAQVALLLLLALARRWRGAQRAFAEAHIGSPLGFELNGRTLGLVGNGQAAKAFGAVAVALGMRVRSVDSRSSRRELLDLAESCDVLSLHCPLTPQTRGLVDAELLRALPRGALLINTARGGIVDRPALEAALEGGHLGGVGLDVFWEEPWRPSDPLFQREDVVVLPHVGGTTEESFARIVEVVAENVRRIEAGEPLLYRVA